MELISGITPQSLVTQTQPIIIDAMRLFAKLGNYEGIFNEVGVKATGRLCIMETKIKITTLNTDTV